MSFLPDWLLHTVYGLPAPAVKRQRPMQVLAVGISRSGTESLREALHELDLRHTYHGFDSILPPSSLEATYRLHRIKYNTDSKSGQCQKLTAEDFDTVLGDCVGVSDLTAAEFAVELIAAYPNAKVILNVRRDLDAWYRSMEQTMGYFDANPMDWDWCKSWFNAELFWIRQTMCRTMMPKFFRGSFRSNGKWVYEQHVALIRGIGLPKERLLEWSVEDGWEPLCDFLGKEVPQSAFPSGNLPVAWAKRITTTMEIHHKRAVRNMIIFSTLVVIFFSILFTFML
jgi:hypothetical protein